MLLYYFTRCVDLEKFRGMAISVNTVCPLALLYIKEMTRALMSCERKLCTEIRPDPHLLSELKAWDEHPEFLDNERPFNSVHEKDVVLHPVCPPDQEFMTGIGVIVIFRF